jgi:copper chaperone CopZ
LNQTIHVDGMTCGGCAHHVHDALAKIPGVHDVTVSLEAKSAVIEADREVSRESLAAALDEAGYVLR